MKKLMINQVWELNKEIGLWVKEQGGSGKKVGLRLTSLKVENCAKLSYRSKSKKSKEKVRCETKKLN